MYHWQEIVAVVIYIKKEKQNHFEIYFVTLFRYELAPSVGSEFFVSDDNHQHWKYSKEASDDQQN